MFVKKFDLILPLGAVVQMRKAVRRTLPGCGVLLSNGGASYYAGRDRSRINGNA